MADPQLVARLALLKVYRSRNELYRKQIIYYEI